MYIIFLIAIMASAMSSSHLKTFLRQTKNSLASAIKNQETFFQTNRIHVFIGNEAADPDSIVSALCLAYLEQSSSAASPKDDGVLCVPMCCIPRADLALRKDTQLLFDMTGLDINDLVCLDDCDGFLGSINSIECQNDQPFAVTLTDHNELANKWESGTAWLADRIVAIVDHHVDKGAHSHVKPPARNIAFNSDTGREGAGSCCTLIAEAFLSKRAVDDTPLEDDVAALLSGVILLDTSNMSVEVGKGTSRDAAALEALWSAATTIDLRASRDATFEKLRSAKTDPSFWLSLTAGDALRLDYKNFAVRASPDPEAYPPLHLGMSSVLCSTEALRSKSDFSDAIARYIEAGGIVNLFVCMAMITNDGPRRRELLMVGTEAQLNELEAFIGSSAAQMEATRILRVPMPGLSDECGIFIDCYSQGNLRMSRKQVGPLLEDFLATRAAMFVTALEA